MKKFIFLKTTFLLFLILFLTSCSLELKPPAIPATSTTLENPIIDKVYEKQVSTLDYFLNKQNEFKKIKNLTELNYFLESTGKISQPRKIDLFNQFVDSPLASIDNKNKKRLYSFVPRNEYDNQTDIIKIKQPYVFIWQDKSIKIFEHQVNQEIKKISQIDFSNQIKNFYIFNDKLIVSGDLIDTENNHSFVKIFDISNKTQIKTIGDFSFGGYYREMLISENRLYFLASESFESQDKIKNKLLSFKKCTDQEKCQWPNIYYFNAIYNKYKIFSWTQIDLTNEKNIPITNYCLAPDNSFLTLYDNSLYISYPQYLSRHRLATECAQEILFDKLSKNEQALIGEINSTNIFLLSDEQKEDKLRIILNNYLATLSKNDLQSESNAYEACLDEKYTADISLLQKTIVHKIGFKTNEISRQATTVVNGLILGKLFFNKKDNFLLTVTHNNINIGKQLPEINEESANIYIFDNSLNTVNTLENIAPKEQFVDVYFAKRWFYLFNKNENKPLTVVKISAGGKIEPLGQLNIPNKTHLLYQLNNDRLFSVGPTSVDNKNRTSTLQIVLWDVSNISKPRKLDKQILGGLDSYSLAWQDYKSSFFSIQNNFLALPIFIKNSSGGVFGNQDFRGVAIFTINRETISLQGLIDHVDLASSKLGKITLDNLDDIQRILYDESVIYTFSNYGLKLSFQRDLHTLSSVVINN